MGRASLCLCYSPQLFCLSAHSFPSPDLFPSFHHLIFLLNFPQLLVLHRVCLQLSMVQMPSSSSVKSLLTFSCTKVPHGISLFSCSTLASVLRFDILGKEGKKWMKLNNKPTPSQQMPVRSQPASQAAAARTGKALSINNPICNQQLLVSFYYKEE